jgi:hypothetical protein
MSNIVDCSIQVQMKFLITSLLTFYLSNFVIGFSLVDLPQDRIHNTYLESVVQLNNIYSLNCSFAISRSQSKFNSTAYISTLYRQL